MKLHGAMITDGRHRKGYTQEEMSKAMPAKSRVSVPVIQRAESGNEIHVSSARAICEFLDVDLAKAVVPTANSQDGVAESSRTDLGAA